jgi:hypothetical protein
MLKAFALTGALIFLSGCPSNAIFTAKPPDSAQLIKSRAQLVGHWFIDAPTKEGGQRLALSEKRPDGTFQTQFRVIEGGKVTLNQTEFGLWGLSGPVYFTITKGVVQGSREVHADPTDPYYYDAYEVLSLDDSSFKYRSFAFGDVYTARKVPADFQFSESANAAQQ